MIVAFRFIVYFIATDACHFCALQAIYNRIYRTNIPFVYSGIVEIEVSIISRHAHCFIAFWQYKTINYNEVFCVWFLNDQPEPPAVITSEPGNFFAIISRIVPVCDL